MHNCVLCESASVSVSGFFKEQIWKQMRAENNKLTEVQFFMTIDYVQY